jgi:hypothetical protein
MQAAIDDIVANSRTVLVIAGAVVMACFLGLASAPWLASTAVRARTTLVAAAVAGGVALAVVGRLVMRALRA